MGVVHKSTIVNSWTIYFFVIAMQYFIAQLLVKN